MDFKRNREGQIIDPYIRGRYDQIHRSEGLTGDLICRNAIAGIVLGGAIMLTGAIGKYLIEPSLPDHRDYVSPDPGRSTLINDISNAFNESIFFGQIIFGLSLAYSSKLFSTRRLERDLKDLESTLPQISYAP